MQFENMTPSPREWVVGLLRTGTPAQRVAFLNDLPPSRFKYSAATLIGSDDPGMVVLSLRPVIQDYCYGSNPDVGALLAVAAHERAIEIWRTVPSHRLIPTTLSGLAFSHAKALTLLGRSQEVLDATEQYIGLYEGLGERENLPLLKVLRIEALISLGRLDDADAELQDETLFLHPIAGPEAKRLRGLVDQYRPQIIAELSSEEEPLPSMDFGIEDETSPDSDDLSLDVDLEEEFADARFESSAPGAASAASSPSPSPASSPSDAWTLAAGIEMSEPPKAGGAPPPPPEVRYLNAEIRDHPKDKPLEVKTTYVLEFGVDLKMEGDASGRLPDAALLFSPGEDLIELTVELQSRDFEIKVARGRRTLELPRTGPSRQKARFNVVPLREGRGTLSATVHKSGNFVMQMEITYSIGSAAAEPTSTVSHGRSIGAATNLQPRELGMLIKPAPGSGYECVVWGAVRQKVVLPITETELGDAIKTTREGLMSVVSQRDGASRFVFQAGLDIDAASQAKALRTLARAGASLFQRIFFGPAAGPDVQGVGAWLRKRATNLKQRLTLQIVAERFPIPWGLLYVGDAGEKASLDWDLFLGMRHIIEQIPLQTNLSVDDSVIRSDSPSLEVSINLNKGIDQQMKTDVVSRQIKFWKASAATLGTRMHVAQRQSRADLVDALAHDANDQLMYLYCHAMTSGPGDPGGINASCFVLTNNERLTLGDLHLDAPMTKQLQGNPLVFINACESAELTPSFYDGFVPYFMAKGARGVIGTECQTPALFATEWALEFFPRFLGGEALGELFLDLRRWFLTEHRNPLGLIYAVHCDGDTQIQPGLTL